MKPDESYEIVREKVLSEIRDHFKLVLNRPEILNRMGENIIVFDFIRHEVAEAIFKQMLDASGQEPSRFVEPEHA